MGFLRAAALLALLPGFFPGAVEASSWARAEGTRTWSFPADHLSHPDYRTEWWYFTGNLAAADGRKFGYQLTFFRVGVARERTFPANPWSLRDLYLAHFTVTDVSNRVFSAAERTSREGPGLAGAGGTGVWLRNWSATWEKDRIVLAARDGGMGLSLFLTPRKGPVLHGDRGLSAKGPSPGQASWYYSLTDLASEGTVTIPYHGTSTPAGGGDPGRGGAASGREVAVRGTSWFDHEFGSNQLAPGQAGWDWFSLHLSDGRDLMLYLLRRADGSVEPASSGTLVERDGTSRHLSLETFTVEARERWKSPRSGALYPARWRIRVPAAGIEVDLSPLLANQELDTKDSTGIVYWEGAVEGKGSSRGRDVTAQGYAELTGYAGSMGGVF